MGNCLYKMNNTNSISNHVACMGAFFLLILINDFGSITCKQEGECVIVELILSNNSSPVHSFPVSGVSASS